MSTLPDTGAYVVQGGAWVESEDPEVAKDGAWVDAYEIAVVVGGVWKTAYLRPIPVVLEVTSPPAGDLLAGIDQNTGTITGTALDALGRPVTGTLAVTRVLITSSGTTQQSRGSITIAVDGTWSFSYDEGLTDPTLINAEQYFMFEYVGISPFLGASVLSHGRQINSNSVTLAITSQPSGNQELGYSSFLVGGTALRADASPAPGYIYISWSIDNGTYSGEQQVAIDAAGNWSRTEGPFGVAGVRRLRVRYEPLPGGTEDATTVYGNTVTAVPRAPTFTKGSVGETSVAMSTPGVLNVSGYQFYRGSTLIQTSSSTSKTDTGRANYTTYGPYKVRSYANSPAGISYYSAFSSEHLARTGRPELRDSGSKIVTITPHSTGSWRSEDAWAGLGDKVGQGTYGTYSSYRGVIDFGSANAVRDALRNALGGDKVARQQQGSCTKAEVYLYKIPGVGTSGSVTILWHRANSDVGGAIGSATYMSSSSSTSSGSAAWYNVGTSLGQLLGDGDQNSSQTRSIQIRNDGTGAYAQFNGKSSGSLDCRLRLTWSWNYVTQTKINGAWTS